MKQHRSFSQAVLVTATVVLAGLGVLALRPSSIVPRGQASPFPIATAHGVLLRSLFDGINDPKLPKEALGRIVEGAANLYIGPIFFARSTAESYIRGSSLLHAAMVSCCRMVQHSVGICGLWSGVWWALLMA